MKSVSGNSSISVDSLSGNTSILETTIEGNNSLTATVLTDDFDSQFEISGGITFDSIVQFFDSTLITFDNG